MCLVKNRFVVVVPVYNAEQYIAKCIISVLSQDYDNYTLIIVNDYSTDKTHGIICKLLEKYNFSYVLNGRRVGSALANFIKGKDLVSGSDQDILAILDGDDSLAHDSVLSRLNKVYQDANVWLTYGQFEPLSGDYHNFCKPIPNTRTYRKDGVWLASHLKSFRRWLFDKIKDEDLRDSDGEYYKIVGDAAYFYPMIEMAGKKHIQFIPEVLYMYNDLNPMNDMKVAGELAVKKVKEIIAKPVYKEINSYGNNSS